LTQVQLRLPEELVEEIDGWVKSGRFRSRSDAIKSMIEIYNERERTREFLKMLDTRSGEAEDSPEKLIPLEESK
jgi:Arc/MetJ-type ribon-helix-helix transcriptional regulator